MPQNNPILESAQQIVESGTAPILGDDGKVSIQDVEQGGYFGQTRTDDQGTYVEYFEPYKPPELELTEGVPLVGTAAMSSQADPRRGEDNFVTKKVYLYPNQEFANTYNNLQPEEREALIRTDEDFRTKTWNFAALDQYNQNGVTSQGQWELVLGGLDVDVSTARQALENVSKKSYEKIAQADSTLQQIVPEQYKRLSEIEDELLELESADELARDDSYYNVKKLELESEYRRILQTPVQTEQGEVPLGNLDAWRQRLYSEQDRARIQNSFWQVYEGSDEQRRQQFYQSEVEKAANDLENWYEKAGAAGYYANLGLRKIARATMDVAANAVGVFAMTPLADLVGHPEAKDWAENMAIDLSIAARAVQGDANAGSMNRYEYAIDDNRTAVVDKDGQLLSIENINGFNLMRNMTDREVSQIQQQIISNRNKIYEDSSWGRLGSEVVDVGLDMAPILMGAGGIGRLATSTVLKTTGKEMLEKGTKMALFQGASAASAFINTLGRNYTSALEQGLNRENATKLALTQSAIEGLAMSVVGGIEARTAAVLSGSVKNQAANAIRGYMSGYYSLDGVAKRLGKVGIQAGKDVIAEVVEENFVEWSQGLAATSYGLEGSYTAQDASNITATTIGLTLLMGGSLGTYRHQFRESRQAPTLDEMGQWRAQLVDKVMTNMDSVERLAKTVGASAGLTPEQVNQKVLQLRHAKQQYDALPPDMPLEERSEYISNVIEIETIKESLPNLNEDQILWESQINVLERRNREILGVPQESSPVSDEISQRANELASENEISAPQDVEVLPSPYGQVEERADESAVEQTSEQPEAEQPAVEDQYVSRDIGGETIFYRVGENGLLSIVNEVPEGASVLTQEEFDAQQGQESVQEDEIIEGEVPVTEEEPAVDQPSDLPIDRADDLSQPEAIEQPTEVQEEAESEVEQPTQAIPERSERGEVITIQIPEKEGVIRPTSAEVVRVGNELKQINPNGIVEDIPPYRIDEYTSIYNEQVPETERIFDQETPSQPTEDTISEQEGADTAQEETTPTEQAQVEVQENISDEEYNNFVDSGIVTQERLNDIAQKIARQEALSQRETAIFNDKTSEINEILSNLRSAEQQPNTSSYVSNSGKELQVQQAEDGNWYRVKKDGSLYKNPITNQDYLDQIEENMSERAETASEDQTTAILSLAPLYSTKVTTEEQAKALINSEMFKKFVENVKNIAKQLGVEVVNINTGVGAFEGVGEVTSAWEVRGNFEDIVELAAIVGGLSPEVQDSTIAAREVEPKSDDHNADMYTLEVEGDTNMIIKALSEVGFDDSGYTLVGNKLYIYDVHEYRIEDFDNKVNTLQTKIENNGGKIRGQENTAVQSVYIDASNREEIISTAVEGTSVQQTDGESLHNARIRAMERTKAFLEWRERINKPSQPSKSLKEYVKLRAKQLGLGMEGKTLSDEERARLKELESEFVVPLNKYFAVDESLYEAAKKEVEAIADEVASLVRDSFVSKFPIKRPARAAIKTVRWYSGQPNLLGDGSRTNIIVSNDADADVIFEELKRRYSVEGITRNEQETTELGYPKRLIEVLTPSGKIAEIQVMTPKGYLAKDGVKYFPKDQKSFARKILEQVREAVGFEVPDGVGHYFYEIDRDTNVPLGLRKRAVELSNIYYSLFTENPPNIDEARFKQDLQNFVNDVESADKSKWDDGNDGKTPIELSLYLNNIFDKQGNINYGKVEEISDGIEQGQGTIGELSLQEEKGRSEGGRTNVEASVILRGDRQANQAQYPGEPEAIAERQEALLEQYAKEKGVWLDESEIEESSTRRLPSGQEASVWLNEDKGTVTKAIDYSVYSENLEEFLNDRIALYNHLFPDTALQVVGFTKTDGKFKVVVSQPLIQGQMLAPEGQTKIPADEQQLLDEYMADTFGMERRGTTYFNSDYVIDDVHGGNVIKSDGKYYFIDVVPSLNEPIDDLGGNRQYRVEPDVVEEQATPDVETAPESLSEIGRKSKQLKGKERIDALVEDAPALLEDNVTARQVFEAVDKKIPLNQIEDILAEAALTAEGQPKTATSNNISKVAKALGIGTKSKIKEGGKVVNVIKDKNGNWKRVDKKGNIIDAPLTREQIAEANSNTSNLFQISDIDMLIEHGLIEKKDC